MTRRLEGRIAVVTGGASGIGRAVCRLFAAEGARVAVLDRSEDGAAATAAEIGDTGGRALPLGVDIAAAEAVRSAFEAVAAEWDAVDILVNCAGIVAGGGGGDSSDDDWSRNMRVNLDGAFYCSREAIRQMERKGGGSIVNIGSITAIHPAPQRAGYGAAKAGVHGLTRAIAVEYARAGIRANVIAPGTVATPLTEALRADEERRDMLLGKIPLGRFATPEDIARPALFLASDDAAYVTGQILIVDGGLTIP